MRSKKLFFPIGAGEDYYERFYGGLSVAKHFCAHMEVLYCYLDPGAAYNMKSTMRGSVLYEQFLRSANEELDREHARIRELFEKAAFELGVLVSDTPVDNIPSANFVVRAGNRSRLVEAESRFCDMVVAAVPLDGKITGTFEAATMKSGKSAIVIPRNLKEFKADNILVSWTGTTASSAALTSAVPLLEQASRVCCITSKASLGNDASINLARLEEYFTIHGIEADFEIIDTTSIPGEALLKTARDGGFDLVIAGKQGENGLREMFLGGTAKFFLKNTEIPVFI